MKKHISIVFIFFLCIGMQLANCQTYPIPDVNLRNRLIQDYPTFMNAEGELIISAAKSTSQDLNLDNANISNADGIQFFESTGILRLRNNNLTSIPQLSLMRSVRRAYISDNKLTSIPNISALYQLIDLYLINNEITTLAEVENITTLQFLTITGNKITQIPNLTKLVNLKTLNVSNNPITFIQDLSTNVNLQLIDISNSNISTIASLSSLSNLEVFNCSNTNFSDLSGLNSNTTLTKLIAKNCKITTLANLSNKPNLTEIDISNNELTFEDIIPLMDLTTLTLFNYSPQKNIHLPLNVDIRETNTFTYTTSIDASLSANAYTWFKNEVPLVTNTSGTFTLAPVYLSDSGVYKVSITNAAVPGLTLTSNESKIKTRLCMEINKVNLEILSSDCRKGAVIDFEGTMIDGAVSPINYMLQSANSVNNIIGTTSTQFSNIIPGTYILQVTDSRNCTTHKTFYLDKGADCESVFSPNGDGIMDNYFIPDIGTVEIYNTSKKLIKTLQVPASWDGTTNNGSLADSGYYVIIINGSSSISVSLMR